MNTELKVTPGDWRTGGSEDIVLVEVDEQPIIECIFTFEPDLLDDDDEREITREEAEANAHLVAAAKDMYNMLQDILDVCDEFEIDLDAVAGRVGNLNNDIEAVLKKARGETDDRGNSEDL
jgi:hypothetical protein